LDGPPGPAFSRAWGKLAQSLGLGLPAARWHLCLSFAQGDLPEFAVAARGQTAWWTFLEDVIAGWDEDRQVRLRECEQLLSDEYRQAEFVALPSH
jgi:hypothetical protein